MLQVWASIDMNLPLSGVGDCARRAEAMGFDGVMFVSSQLPEDPTERKKRSLSRGLAARDLQVVSDGQQLIEAVSAIRMFDAVVRAEGIERRVAVYGVTPSYATIHTRQVSAGRWLDEGDALERRKVAVLGTELAAKLFGEQNPIGCSLPMRDRSSSQTTLSPCSFSGYPLNRSMDIFIFARS